MQENDILFNKFKILEPIGEGGTSKVYLAENLKLGNKWAIKKAYKGQSDISLHAEPTILIKLDHKAIPKIIDIEEDDEAIYIIEEYIEGIHLKDYKVRHSRIEEKLIIDWAIQICDILQYLHTLKPHPIIFRDLKPENIIIRKNGQLALVDFGIAREFKETSNNDTIQIGTRGYAAPEQYGIGQSDGRTDIYSLGVTLYYLLTGRSLANPPYKIEEVRYYNESVSEALEKIVLKCCEILPDKRYQTAGELKSELVAFGGAIQREDIKRDQGDISNEKVSNKKLKLNIDKNKTIMIGIVGVRQGVGVTHTCLLLGNYLRRKGKVALVEMNRSGHFTSICGLREEEREEQCMERYKKVDYYFNINYSKFVANYRDRYQFVIVDFGSYEEFIYMDEFVHSDIRIVVGQGMDWKLNEIMQFYESTKQYDERGRWQYVIPFLDRRHLKDVKQIVDNDVYALPFNMNPFAPERETIKGLERIMNRRR